MVILISLVDLTMVVTLSMILTAYVMQLSLQVFRRKYMNYQQIETEKNGIHEIFWLECSKAFKKGDLVRVKGQDDFRTIVEIFPKTLVKGEIKREWNAGGLDQRNRIT